MEVNDLLQSTSKPKEIKKEAPAVPRDDDEMDVDEKVLSLPEIPRLRHEEKVEITRADIIQRLSNDRVVDLVFETLRKGYFPSTMPAQFAQEFKPIGDISMARQRENVAYYLAQWLTAKNVGPGAEKAKERDREIDRQIEMRKRPEQMKMMKKQHSIDRKKAFLESKKKTAAFKVSTPAGPRKVKPWSLTAAAKKLSLDDKEEQSEAAVARILRARQDPSVKSSVQAYKVKLLKYRAASELHTRLVARLVSQFGGQLHEDLLSFLMRDPKKINEKLELCLQWLYDEYQQTSDMFEQSIEKIYEQESNYG